MQLKQECWAIYSSHCLRRLASPGQLQHPALYTYHLHKQTFEMHVQVPLQV